MKVISRSLAFLTVMLYGMVCFGRSDSKAHLPNLKTQLEQMGTADQGVRNRLMPFLKTGDLQSNEFAAVAQDMARIDAENLTKLEQIIEKYGWPDMRVVGPDASNAAFLILQHGPSTAQQKLLPNFREAVASGKARPDHLAMLEDRVRTSEGKRQLYGTQVDVGTDGKPRLSPVEDPQNLDARRTAVGLPPMSVYLDSMQSGFGQKIDTSVLTIEDDELTPNTSLERTREK
jgi:hypothetical protein